MRLTLSDRNELRSFTRLNFFLSRSFNFCDTFEIQAIYMQIIIIIEYNTGTSTRSTRLPNESVSSEWPLLFFRWSGFLRIPTIAIDNRSLEICTLEWMCWNMFAICFSSNTVLREFGYRCILLWNYFRMQFFVLTEICCLRLSMLYHQVKSESISNVIPMR